MQNARPWATATPAVSGRRPRHRESARYQHHPDFRYSQESQLRHHHNAGGFRAPTAMRSHPDNNFLDNPGVQRPSFHAAGTRPEDSDLIETTTSTRTTQPYVSGRRRPDDPRPVSAPDCDRRGNDNVVRNIALRQLARGTCFRRSRPDVCGPAGATRRSCRCNPTAFPPSTCTEPVLRKPDGVRPTDRQANGNRGPQTGARLLVDQYLGKTRATAARKPEGRHSVQRHRRRRPRSCRRVRQLGAWARSARQRNRNCSTPRRITSRPAPSVVSRLRQAVGGPPADAPRCRASSAAVRCSQVRA